MTRYSNNAANNLLADCVEGSEGARQIRTTATISGDVNVDSTSLDMSGYVGKESATNADFSTAYASSTTITLADLPSDVDAFTADDIASVVQIAADGSVTNTFTRDDKTMSMSTNVLTVTGASFESDDTFVVYTNIARPSGGSGSSPDAEFTSPKDFTATYTSSTTITLSSLPMTIVDSSQIAYVTLIPSSGDAETYTQGSSGVTLTVSSNVVTISGAGTPFSSGDVYQIGLNGQKKAFDASTNSNLSSELNPEYGHYTDPEQLVTASDIGASDGVYINQGAEISMDSYNVLGIFVKFTVSDSTTNTIKVLAKHESGGSEEFVLETSGEYIKTLGDSNINIYYEFETNHTIPYLQIQSAAADVDTGGGTEGTLEIYITKGRK